MKPTFRSAASNAAPFAPQKQRVFLIVLGRGRLQPPSKGVDAALQFVHERLLPQDQAAVLAYNRATDFTTDHAKVEVVLERFKRAHERIETDLREYFSGLRAVYGGKTIPEHIQVRINDVFQAPGAPPSRNVTAAQIPEGGRADADARKTSDATMRAAIIEQRKANGMPLPFDAAEENFQDPALQDFSFDEYVGVQSKTSQDLDNLYSGIKYMRYLDGEKHLVFLTENGLFLPRLEHDQSLAAIASDARVVIDTIQTGGLGGGRMPRSLADTPVPIAGGGRTPTPPPPGPTITETFAIESLKTISELTGGQSTRYQMGAVAMDRIDRATRFEYLLGYDETYQRMMREGVKHVARVSVKTSARYVKVIAYNYAADATGTATANVPQR